MKDKDTFNTLNVVTTAMLAAVALVLANVLHHLFTDAAALLSPMHFPVLLMGILCGPWLGLIGGVITPLVSWLTSSGTPSATPDRYIPMMFELATYGFLTGMMRKVFIKNPKTNRFASILALVIAMVAGRLINAVVKSIFLVAKPGNNDTYIATLWARFILNFQSTWAGILVQLVLIPVILFALQRSGILLKYLPDTPMAKRAVASTAVDEPSTETEQDSASSEQASEQK